MSEQTSISNVTTLTDENMERLIRVYGLFYSVSQVVEEDPQVISDAKELSGNVLNDLCNEYISRHGQEKLELILNAPREEGVAQ